MSWGKLVWGRDLRERTWVLPPMVQDLPLDLKRTALYPKQKAIVAEAAEAYLANRRPQPHYAPQAAGRAWQNASPPVDPGDYVRSPYIANKEGNALAKRVSAEAVPTLVINPQQWASMRRGASSLPGYREGQASTITADLLARGRVDPRALTEYANDEAEAKGYARQTRAQRMGHALSQAATAAAYGRTDEE